MPFDILTPPKMIVGPAALTRLGDSVAAIGRSALVVTGRKAMRKAGVTEQLSNRLALAGVRVSLFEDVPPEPTCEVCDAIRDAIRSDRCNVVIGLGGGSVMDAAKVAAGLSEEEPPVIEFWWEKATVSVRGIPFVAVPTVSGSGAEATRNGVITNPDVPAKRSIRDDSFVAKLIVVDPYLSLSTPSDVTARSGLDGLVQAIESFVSRGANPVTDAWALEAVSRLKDSVLAATRTGGDLLARTEVAYGSLLSGLALSNARLGLVHGLAHPLGARFKAPHGVVCAALLPHVVRFNREAAAAKFARLDQAFGADTATAFEKLAADLGMPGDLKSLGVKPSDLPVIIEEALPSGSTKSNPRTVTPEACAEILRAVI